MKLDGPAVQYLLVQEFGDVAGEGLFRATMFDCPMLYDLSVDMGGHMVLVHPDDRPASDTSMEGTLCVCTGEASARSAREAGAATVLIRGEVTFQHLYNRMQRIFVENERLDAQLRALVNTYAGFQPLLDACAHAIGCPCALIDEQYRPVCVSSAAGAGAGAGVIADAGGQGGKSRQAHQASQASQVHQVRRDALEPDAIDLFMASREYRYMRASRKAFTVPNSENLMMKNVFFKGRLVGSLVMEHRGDALSARYVRFMLNYLGAFVEEAYGRIGSFGVTSVGAGQVKAALQDALEGGVAEYARLEAALVEGGHASGCDYVVLRAERSFTNEGAEERDYLVRRLELAWPNAYCFTSGDGLYVLVDVSEGVLGSGARFAKELPLVARENLSKMGVSRPFSEVSRLNAAIAQARIALEHGSRKDPTSWCYRFGDYAFSWLVERAVGDIPFEYVCHPAVTALLRYDEAHGADLLNTLAVFVRCRYNATSAARELYVARSTLLHRLVRIEELAKVDFDNPYDLAYLSLSFVMLE